MGHTVQIILQDDLPGGKGYVGDVVTVKAGYARNYLIPTRKAYYATPENLERFGVSAALAKKGERMEVEEVSDDKKAADLLRKYLNQKTVSRTKNILLVLILEGSCSITSVVTMTCAIELFS